MNYAIMLAGDPISRAFTKKDKRAAIGNEILIDAFMRSNKTFEETMGFFQLGMKLEDTMSKNDKDHKKMSIHQHFLYRKC